MLEIVVFAFGIMYTPGPVNMLSLFTGVNGADKRALLFCLGVGVAMTLMFLILGYLGAGLISPAYQRYAAYVGAAYIAYLAVKIFRASLVQSELKLAKSSIGFAAGFLMQATNPKALLVGLPIVGVMFPHAHIEGDLIAVWAFILGGMGFGAPAIYLLTGYKLKRFALNPKVMAWVNRCMALLLSLAAAQFIATALT